MRPDLCVVCGQRITMRGWEPYCCEVCWDSGDAEEARYFDQLLKEWDDVVRRQGGTTRAPHQSGHLP